MHFPFEKQSLGNRKNTKGRGYLSLFWWKKKTITISSFILEERVKAKWWFIIADKVRARGNKYLGFQGRGLSLEFLSFEVFF
jgi:hypothetical protein